MQTHEYIPAENMEEMINQYQYTLKQTKERLKELQKDLSPFSSVYKDVNRPKEERLEAKEASAWIREETAIYKSIQRDLEYSLCWMQNGRAPKSKRGIERRSAYEKEKPVDPVLMQRYFRAKEATVPWTENKIDKHYYVTKSESYLIGKALQSLSDKEREAYVMYRGEQFSQYKIAELMQLSRNSIKTMIHRADRKIQQVMKEEREGA